MTQDQTSLLLMWDSLRATGFSVQIGAEATVDHINPCHESSAHVYGSTARCLTTSDSHIMHNNENKNFRVCHAFVTNYTFDPFYTFIP
jgi:hypothetical protein